MNRRDFFKSIAAVLVAHDILTDTAQLPYAPTLPEQRALYIERLGNLKLFIISHDFAVLSGGLSKSTLHARALSYVDITATIVHRDDASVNSIQALVQKMLGMTPAVLDWSDDKKFRLDRIDLDEIAVCQSMPMIDVTTLNDDDGRRYISGSIPDKLPWEDK